MSFKTTKCLNMDQVLAATCVIMCLFNLAAALKLHQIKVHGQGTSKMYKCDTCEYSSNRADAFKAHKVKQHGLIIPDAEMVPCINAPECKQKFITQENMRQPLQINMLEASHNHMPTSRV